MEMRNHVLFLILLCLFVSAWSQGSDHETKGLLRRFKRRWVLSTIELEEESPGPYPREATKLFNDRKFGDEHHFRIKGMGVDQEPIGVFTINPKTGAVIVHKPVDREQYPTFLIEFDVLDTNEQPVDRTLAFNVAVKDINDNPPKFNPANLVASVKESISEGELPVNLQAYDNDEDGNDNSMFSMRIVSQTPPSPKIILKTVPGTKMSQLAYSGCFDFDKEKIYKILVEAKDKGVPPLSSTTTITLNIEDSNSHQPIFKQKSYDTKVKEMVTGEILRIHALDKDAPNTPASHPKFNIIKGNEEGNYMIETDPKTLEGVLTVVRGKDYERTSVVNLTISVENEEPFVSCNKWVRVAPANLPAPETATVTVKIEDVNDPPVFEKTKFNAYEKEESAPGKVLYTPKVTDVDSDIDKIRYELVNDSAHWLTLDKKTGALTTAKKMDHESPFVHDGIYTVKVLAIDNGEPPATATSTVYIHLGDINDNAPVLLNNNTIMCANKVNGVNISAMDSDDAPYSGPFTFSVGGDEDLKKRWKFDPATGVNTTLYSLKSLAFGNYEVPLKIMDQQNKAGESMLLVTVCDCGLGHHCRQPLPTATRLSGPGVSTLIVGLLLLLLLLCLIFLCECGAKEFQHMPVSLQDEGHQTLIKYNEEGGGSACKAEPALLMSPDFAVTDGIKQHGLQMAQMSAHSIKGDMQEDTFDMFRSQRQSFEAQTNGAFQGYGQSPAQYQAWNSFRSNTMRNGSATFSRSINMMSARYLEDHLGRRAVYAVGADPADYPVFQPHEYAYEGSDSRCHSLDELSLSNCGDDLDFLQNLGPKFNALGGICQQHLDKKSAKH
ncbi:cadherin-like protein 26 [Denticeps clupeoides]|uniref:Cadherin domain-containing protein n=1 Tax=Denticeps clupeoides TaxID=299321 RepID=A0AAY4CXC4_9TELE|nr:cadherin-like protein 26 [Denticeps clupeoides]